MQVIIGGLLPETPSGGNNSPVYRETIYMDNQVPKQANIKKFRTVFKQHITIPLLSSPRK